MNATPSLSDHGPDRRKKVHRITPPQGDGSPQPSGDPTPDRASDRRKIIHRSPSASGTPSEPPPETTPPDRRKVVHQRPRATRTDRHSLGSVQVSEGDNGTGHSVGTRLTGAAHRLAATLMLLALIGSALGGERPVHDDPHEAHAVAHQEASFVHGLHALYALALIGWQALAGDDICGDCNLPADDGCRCVCYSGGYDPDDPACQE